MIDILNRFLAPPPALAADEEPEAAARARALETLVALSNLLCEPVPTKHHEAAEPGSVAAWSPKIQQSRKELLADPHTACPPYSDPRSVLIVDQDTLEFELDTTPPTNNNSKVQFRDRISVVEIPSYKDMRRSIVNSVWSSTEEVYQNGRRNANEYNWEGRNAANVLEEDEMLYDPNTGDYIHPATWEEMEEERCQQELAQEMARLTEEQAQMEKERVAFAMAVEQAEQRFRHQETNKNKSPKHRRRRKTSSKTSTKIKTSPRINNMHRRKSPAQASLMANSGSLTRFADT